MTPRLLLISAFAICTVTTTAIAKPSAELIASGLHRPTFLTAPSGSDTFLFILEKNGKVRLFDRKSGKVLPHPLLDITASVNAHANERGLLGMAFSPDFKTDKRFYLYYTDVKGDTQVSRFTMPDTSAVSISPKTEEKLLNVKQDFANHNGGWIGFGPDKMLYIGLGDGGAANDPKQRAQDLSNHLGKILRIDVTSATGYRIPTDNPFLKDKNAKPEIYAYGLRNPWRCSWDGSQFFIADVGQNKTEEVNAVSSQQLKGANFGWRLREGNHATPDQNVGGERPAAAIDPIHTYTHGSGVNEGFSVTGGYVYHGSIKALRGHYFFADYNIGNIWSFPINKGKPSTVKHWTDAFSHDGKKISQITSFGLDPQGELYILSDQGTIFKIVDRP